MSYSSASKTECNSAYPSIPKIVSLTAWTMLALAAELWAALTMIDRSDDLGIYRILTGKNCLITPDIRYVQTAFTILLLFILIIILCSFSRVIKTHTSNTYLIIFHHALHYLFVTAFIISALAISFILKKDVLDKYTSEKEIARIRAEAAESKFIIHACGKLLDGDTSYDYTNSVDALVNCYNNGNTFVEVDFLWTADGELVCAHNGKSTWAYGYDFKEAPTRDEFLNQKYMGKFTSMDVEFLASFMRQNPDLTVVTDIKDNILDGCAYIARKYPDLKDRFIIQIYHNSEYTPISDMGFNNIIYTLYNAEQYEITPETLIANTRQFDLVGIAFWDYWMDDAAFFEVLSEQATLPLFIHTVNDPEEIKRGLARGVYIYTDEYDLN